ncbi:MAG: rod shape-determining protein MreD [Proteobacteria bacterium]|nr:rod shape-determining protein MreD [Pseudomonadota bacterium]
MNEPILPTVQRLSRATVPFALCLLLVLITALPLTIPYIGSVTPMFALMAVFYWCIYRPEYLPPYMIFIVGVLYDVLAGGPLGLTALLLLLVHGFIVPQQRVFHGKSFVIEWFGFAIVTLGLGVIGWFVASIYYLTPMQPLPVIGQAALTIAIYPCVAWMINQVHRRLVHQEVE